MNCVFLGKFPSQSLKLSLLFHLKWKTFAYLSPWHIGPNIPSIYTWNFFPFLLSFSFCALNNGVGGVKWKKVLGKTWCWMVVLRINIKISSQFSNSLTMLENFTLEMGGAKKWLNRKWKFIISFTFLFAFQREHFDTCLFFLKAWFCGISSPSFLPWLYLSLVIPLDVPGRRYT